MNSIINPDYKFLESFIVSIPSIFETSGDLIHQGRNTLKIYSVEGVEVVVKRFKNPHIINRFVYCTLRLSKARRSYLYGMELLKKGINTPQPIACIERYNWGLVDSYYICLHSELKHQIRDFWTTPEIGNRAFILKAFGEFTAQMHQKRVIHLDYSAGNILFDVEKGNPVFSLVDINRMRFNHSIPEEDGYKSFKRLWLPDETFVVIAKAYARAFGYNEAHAVDRVRYHKNQFMKHRK